MNPLTISSAGTSTAQALVRSADHEAAQRMFRDFDDTLAGIARRREELAERGITSEVGALAVPAPPPQQAEAPATTPGTEAAVRPVRREGGGRSDRGDRTAFSPGGSGRQQAAGEAGADAERVPVQAGDRTRVQQMQQAQGGPSSMQSVRSMQVAAGRGPSSVRVPLGAVRAVGGVNAVQAKTGTPTIRDGAGGAQRLPRSAAGRGVRAQSAPTRVQRDALIEQIQRGLAQALKKRDGELTLRLRPEHLGMVRVRVRVEESSVTALLEASSEQARGLLKAHLTTLREALEARGLSVERIDVEHDPGAQLAREGDAHQRHGGAERHAGRYGRSPERASAEPAVSAYEAGAEALIDVGLGRVDALA